MRTPALPDRPDIQALEDALSAPFGPGQLHCKPGKVAGNRAMVLWYLDARDVQDRLDDVVGVLGWQDRYDVLPDGCVVCRLRIRLGTEWITKMDVGSPSEQSDPGDRLKASFSDALKRAAVKFGVGRFLYRVGQVWADFDPQKKKFVRPPELPREVLAQLAAPTPPRPAPPAMPPEPVRPRDTGKADDLISAAWVDYLVNVMADRGFTDLEKVCAKHKVKSLAELTYARCWKSLGTLADLPRKPQPQTA
jgi:hypothetical protein